MIDREMPVYITYEIVYRVKNGKRLLRAYRGDDKSTYEEILAKLEKRRDLGYLSKSITHTKVASYD